MIATLFGAFLAPGTHFEPRYNIAPTTAASVIHRANPQRTLELMHWGLIPHWSKEPGMKYPTFNARAEEAATKPTFRGPMRYRRCLVPLDGFYEWKKTGEKSKQPYFITMADEKPFALAGLWNVWHDELQSYTILTTTPNDLMAAIHTRMPVILDRDDYDRWLNPSIQDPAVVADLLRPYPSVLMLATPVSSYVSNTRNEGPRCIEAIAPTMF